MRVKTLPQLVSNVLFTGVRGIGILRTSPFGHSRKLAFHFTEFSEVRIQGILGSWSTLRTGSTTTRSGSGLTNNRGAIRLGYPDGSLALGVLGAECPKRFARLVELVGLLDVDLERPGLEQSCETL